MAGNKEINTFAKKWIAVIKDPDMDPYKVLDMPGGMGDECHELGFEMDCGHSFSEAFGNEAFNNTGSLKDIIDEVDDIYLLGSAVFSQWRYYNHWAYSSAEFTEPECRAWFITALGRLAKLTEK